MITTTLTKDDAKVGDRVKYVGNISALYGKTATIRVIHPYLDMIRVDFDGDVVGYRNRGFYVYRFQKLEEALPGEYVIMLKRGGQYEPATNPRIMSSEAQAKAVAISMAERHTGEFVVFKAVRSEYVPPKVERTSKVFA